MGPRPTTRGRGPHSPPALGHLPPRHGAKTPMWGQHRALALSPPLCPHPTLAEGHFPEAGGQAAAGGRMSSCYRCFPPA